MITYIGNSEFDDICLPLKKKNEFGIDTFVRRVKGRRTAAEAFAASLAQGQAYQEYFLQTWEPDEDDPVWATFTLLYKGLLTGTPPVDVQTDIRSAVGRVTKSYLNQNGGKGITLRNRVLWKFQYNIPSEPLAFDEQIATRPVYTTSATLEFLYHAVESRYRYVTVGPNLHPQHSEVASDYVPVLEEARIATSDGMTYGIDNLPAFNMTPVLHTRVESWSSKNVIGTPYYECEDIVRLELVDPAEFP